MYKNPLQNYDTRPAEGNPTQSEAWALLQAALKMRDALRSEQDEEMKAAVRLNWRLWTIFQADLLSPNCQIPSEIRQNILTLANFIDKHSIDFMGNPIAANVDVLININREIAGGLHEGAKHAGAEQVDAASAGDVENPSVPHVDLSDLKA